MLLDNMRIAVGAYIVEKLHFQYTNIGKITFIWQQLHPNIFCLMENLFLWRLCPRMFIPQFLFKRKQSFANAGLQGIASLLVLEAGLEPARRLNAKGF